MPLSLNMKPLCLLVVLLTWVSDPAGAAVLDTDIPFDAGDWTENGYDIPNYSAQTAPLVCQLSTCELLLKELGAMQEKMRAMETRLQASETEAEVRTEIMEAKLQAHKNEIEKLKEENKVKPKVAFAAALGDGGHVGPARTEHTIPFKKILTNVGSAYNSSTGVFIVPVRGVYYLSFSVFTPGKTGHAPCVSLFRDDLRLLTACDKNFHLSNSAGNGATLLLEKGDRIYMTLHAEGMIFDDFHNRSCFRGFLLYQMSTA